MMEEKLSLIIFDNRFVEHVIKTPYIIDLNHRDKMTQRQLDKDFYVKNGMVCYKTKLERTLKKGGFY